METYEEAYARTQKRIQNHIERKSIQKWILLLLDFISV